MISQLSQALPVAGLIVMVAFPASAATHTVSVIERAWRAREQRLRNVEVVWSERRVIARGALSGPRIGRTENRTEDVPPHDLEMEVPRVLLRVSVNGQTYRETEIDDAAAMRRGEHGTRVLFSSFNGTTGKDYTSSGQYGRGVIFGGRYQDLRVLPLKPALLYLRPLAMDGLAMRLDRASIAGDVVPLEGAECVLLQGPAGRSLSWQLWVDPARDFVPLRYEGLDRGVLYSLVTMTYRRHSSGEWIPARWTASFVDSSGRPTRSYDATVLDFTIADSFPDDAFEIEYPPGTWLVDRATNQQWIVRESGDHRLITSLELMRGVSHEELVATESGMAGRRDRGRVRLWALVCTSLALLTVMGAFFVVRRAIH